jgi:hypothetical protein
MRGQASAWRSRSGSPIASSLSSGAKWTSCGAATDGYKAPTATRRSMPIIGRFVRIGKFRMTGHAPAAS